MVRKYENEDLKSLKGVYLIDFYADWCGPCKMLGQVLDTLEDVDILKVNVDENESLAKEYKVMSIPNMFIIKDGEIKSQMIGFRTRDDILKEIEKINN